MSDLNEEIQKLKERGMSLRLMAATLNMSHEGVRKRLKALERGKQVSTGSNAHKSRTSEELKATVNQVSNQRTPPLPLSVSVNPSGIASCMLSECKKRVFQEVLSDHGDLLEVIKDFLEANGIEVYRINVEPEGYQVKHKGQIIRLYVQRNKEETE